MALIKTPDGGFYFDDSQVDIDYEANSVTLLGGGGEAGVTSFNGRSGVVTPEDGDYTAEQVGALPVDGGAMTGNIDMGGNDVTGLHAVVAEGSVNSGLLFESNGNIVGVVTGGSRSATFTANSIDVYDHTIGRVGAPIQDTDAARKVEVDTVAHVVNEILDGTEALPYLSTAGGKMDADAVITGTEEMQLTVPNAGESGTIGVTAQGASMIHATDGDATAYVRVVEETVSVGGGDTVITVNGSGVNFGGAVLTGVNSIGGNGDTELAVESVMDMNNHKITGLANGTDATDAATVGQIPTAVINSLPSQMFVDLVNVQRTATTNTAEIQIATKQENGTYSTAVQHGVLTLIGAGQGADGVNGAGLMIASDKAKLDGIPTPTADDNGKILCVENGTYVLKTLAELQG